MPIRSQNICRILYWTPGK